MMDIRQCTAEVCYIDFQYRLHFYERFANGTLYSS